MAEPPLLSSLTGTAKRARSVGISMLCVLLWYYPNTESRKLALSTVRTVRRQIGEIFAKGDVAS